MKTIGLIMILNFLILFSISYGQDKILLKTGEEINAWIVEKSEKEILYKIFDSEDSPIIVLRTYKVGKITYRNGQEINLVPDGVRMNKRFGLNGGILVGLNVDFGLYKIQADYFISPGLNIEFSGLIESENGGGLPGLSIGAKYYFNPNNPKVHKGYAGLSGGVLWEEFFVQIPFGISLTGKKGFDLKLGLNGLYFPSYSAFGISAELLIGWRF